MPKIAKLPWDEAKEAIRRSWRQGEHVTILGPTGSGKTTLALELLRLRKWVVVLATKPADDVMAQMQVELRAQRWTKDWKDVPKQYQRIVFAPPITHLDGMTGQAAILASTLDQLYAEGGWTIYVDELIYLTDYLRLSSEYTLLMTQGRSLGITVVSATQRPKRVPMVAYDQASYLAVFRFQDKADYDRIAEMAGYHEPLVSKLLPSLERYQFLWYNVTDGTGFVTKVNRR